MVKNTQPLVKNKVTKTHKSFVRFHAGRFKRVGSSWRRPRGIDNRMRRQFKMFVGTMPNIGYGTNSKFRHLLPNGFYKFRITKPADIELLLMHNQKYCAELAANLSIRKRMEIIKRASELGVRITNANARFEKEENE